MTLIAFCLATFLGLLGCETPGGGGGGGAPVSAAIAVDPVYLTPGQTTARLAWPASDGPIDSYFVFESRNGSGYAFTTLVSNASTTITGTPGDRVQITVIGVSPSGEVSESSPPSPPMIFQAGASPAVAAVVPSGATPITATESASDTRSNGETGSSESEVASTTDDRNGDEDSLENADAREESTESNRLAQAIRELLLGADARLPESGLSAVASRWLQGQVDQEIAAGVSLAGTGRANDDPLRELVWLDQAGQLFVSDGQNFLDSEDSPSTFEEALRLRATERFVGLADFDGDGRGDWLVEDTVTGEVWMIDGATDESVPSVLHDADSRLAGLGDFDGDGRSELLWIGTDNRLRVTRPGAYMETMAISAAGPEGFELLAIADLDGNGLDDLLGRNADGSLSMALALATDSQSMDDLDSGDPYDYGDSATGGSPVVLEWRSGTSELSDQLDLVATLDVDEDGAAEIAWLNGDSLEIWTADQGHRTTLSF